VITLPYSDTYFVSAYPRECTETFQAAHVAGFEFFGAVPLRISYEYVPRNIFIIMCPPWLCGRAGMDHALAEVGG
jgi:hypothetical protein